MSAAPALLWAWRKPFAIARKASRTETTRAIATTEESDIQKRCGMLRMFMAAMARDCLPKAAMLISVRAR